MPKRSSKKKDENETAFDILQKATSEQSPNPIQETPQKNPAAVALGRLGGLKGGKARAAKLSAKKRKEIARKAAEVRWSNPSKDY
jgi:hypothetical protein